MHQITMEEIINKINLGLQTLSDWEQRAQLIVFTEIRCKQLSSFPGVKRGVGI
jgi:hypothetical protein